MLLESIKSVVWGIPTVFTVLAFGVYFTVKSGLYRPKALALALTRVFGSFGRSEKGGVSPFAAAATALGGTVGVGSVIGVGIGIARGGPGSVFWMWVCSFFGMGLKYAEVAISLKGRGEKGGALRGGAPYRLKSLGYGGLAAEFCLACVLCSFGSGNIAQSAAIAGFLGRSGLPAAAIAPVCGAVVAFAVSGGGRRIARLNSVIVPAASALYIAACLAVLILRRGSVGEAFGSIFRGAFGLRSAAWGISGAAFSAALREGVARSVFSNEAGMGSSPLAHSASAGGDELQCSFGVFEIFFDTFVVSTLTALALLVCGTGDVYSAFGGVFGAPGGIVIGALVSVFAFASVISWAFYAESCVVCLFGDRRAPVLVFRALFALAACFAAAIPMSSVIALSDILNVFMMIPNLFLLYKCRGEIKKEPPRCGLTNRKAN